jgi:hypothetical protein
MPATNSPPTEPAPTPPAAALTVHVTGKGGAALTDDVRGQVKLSYRLSDGTADNGQQLAADGYLRVPQVKMGTVTQVCVQAPKRWQVAKETNARKPDPNNDPGLACLDFATPPQVTELDFALEQAG